MTKSLLISRCRIAVLLALSLVMPGRGSAQPTTPPSGVAFSAGFQPGGQQLYALDFRSTPVGEFPTSLQFLDGIMEVVLKNGVRMLKASAASAFLITLPQVLPQDFTLEFDLIPKSCCPPPDLSIEGTPRINQGEASAHLLWQADGYLAVIGGAQDNYETPMPENLRASLPGVLTKVAVSVEGSTIKLYTNGRRLFTLDRQFARRDVLRVFLGGVDDVNAVYLAGLRIATGAPVLAAGPTPGAPPAPFPIPGTAIPVAPQTGIAIPLPAPSPAPNPGTAIPVAPQTGTTTPLPPPSPAPGPGTAIPVAPQTGAASPMPAPAPVSRYRVVALGFHVVGKTNDNVLNFDGVEDEIYFATIVNTTDRALSTSYVTTSISPTFGDIAGFPNRLKGGSASPNGGIKSGDFLPALIDLTAPTGKAFPMVLWEGPLDDQGMVVLHPTLWEADKGVNAYTGWMRLQSNRAKASYAAMPLTQQAIQSLRDADVLGPGSGEVITSCVTPTPSRRIYVDVCIDGEDRPIGLAPAANGVDYSIDDRFIVLTRAGIEKALQQAANFPGFNQAGFNPSAPGVIPFRFRDAASKPPFGMGDYYLYLRVERVPSSATTASSSSPLLSSTLATASQSPISVVGSGGIQAVGTATTSPTATPVNAPAGPGVTAGPVPTNRPAPSAVTTTTTASQSQASTGSVLPTVVSNVSVTQGTAGPLVSWQPVPVRAMYSVRRWKIDDAVCCNNASGATPTLTVPPWQDAQPQVAGTYVYEVTAAMAGGTASGQAQFVVFQSGGGQIATVAPSQPPATALPAAPVTGSITPMRPQPGGTITGATSTSTPTAPAAAAGPATLTASSLPVWGTNVRWAEVIGAVRYEVERGPSAQSFGAFTSVTTATQQAQAGTYGIEDLTVQPGSTTYYRVRSVFSNGTSSLYSPVARYDAVPRVPYVTNLSTLKVFSGPLSPVGPLGYRGVRWAWTAITGTLSYAIQTDVFARDATGGLLPVRGGSKRTATSQNQYEDDFQVTAGSAVRICVSVVFPPSQTDPLLHAVCQMTDIP